VGPSPKTLEMLGDKARARQIAEWSGVPVLAGSITATSLEEARAFLAAHDDGIMIKAIAGGGGRGMRPVHRPEHLEAAYARCRSEALQAFGNGDLYVERLMPRARHIEVQIAGDRSGNVCHFWDRECSIQRQRQKLIETAPALGLEPRLRERMLDAAIAIGRAVGLDNLATVEFLVGLGAHGEPTSAFIEANPRLQVEHTVTEEITGLDLVGIQLDLAWGRTLHELRFDLQQMPEPRGVAM